MKLNRASTVLAAATTFAHLVPSARYGIFRDELYYLACARHLDWGYVDHPPIVAVMAWFVQHTVGESLVALRLLPALAAGATVMLSAAMARQLGGGSFAQALAALTVALAPQYVGMLSIYSMNALDLVVWAMLILLLMRLLAGDARPLWIAFGVIAGIGLQNKLSVLFLGFGVAVGLAAARQWHHLRDRHLWIGAALAAVIFAPHVAWQAAHGWPTIEFVTRATEIKNVAFSPLEFLAQQVLIMNPVAAPLWMAGLGYLILGRDMRPYRALGFGYLAILALMMTQSAKPYYLTPIYPALLAAGAVVLERRASSGGWRFLRPTAAIAILVSGLVLAPLAKPILPTDTFVRYAAALGMAPSADERHQLGRLPQFFADMHGWEELASAVATVHRGLPPADRSRACVFAQNYGQAGAIDYFGPGLGLPRAISGHNSYWLWGPGECAGDVVIVIGGRQEDIAAVFGEVMAAGRVDCHDCMPYEDDQVLWVARLPRLPIDELWGRTKHFD